MLRRTLLCLALFATAEAAKAKADPKEYEVCIANLEAIDKLIDKDEKTSKQSIMEAITKHCGDLQNEQPNPALNARDRKMCYYFEPIRAAIAQPFSTRMPKDRVCKRLKQSNGEICNVKYQVQVDNNLSDEEMLAQLKKKRVKELKGILNDRGVKCEGCLEKDDFIKKIMATNGMSTDF